MTAGSRTVAHLDVAGPADAPAIVLIHGSVVTRQMWLPQVRGLSDEFRVITGDLPGHGTLAQVPFTFAAAVDDVAEIIRHEAHGSAVVAGLSLGGYVAIELAARHPGLVAGLVLSGCSINFTGALGWYLKAASALMRRGWLTQSRARAEAKVRRLFPPALADVADAQLRAGVFPQTLGPSFAELAGRDFTLPLRRYLGPVLILNGERDRAARRGQARFEAALTNGRAQVIPGAGHACSLDQPDAYNQAVRDFVRSIRAGVSGV